MNFNDPNFKILFTIMCFFQTVIYGLFYHKFLIPKYKNKSLIIFIIILFTISVSLNNIYGILPFKMLIYMIFFFIASFTLYNGTLIKRILAAPILYAVTAFVDFLFQFILIFIFQYPNFINAPLGIYIFIFILETILIFIILNIILLYTHSSLFSSEKFSRLFIYLTMTVFIISIILSDSFYYNDIIILDPLFKNFTVSYITISICFMCFLFLIRTIYKYIQSLKQSITSEMITQQIYNQYIHQLNQYIDMKENDENMKHLRHDIMNYIQTIHTIKEDTYGKHK